MSKILTFTNGEKINGLTYIGEAGKQLQKNGEYKRLVMMQCFCGLIFTPRLNDLRTGRSNSCGCTKAEITRATHTIHGLSADRKSNPIYSVWKGIKSRCLNKKDKGYHNYGGRGISVCDEWKNDPMPFYSWAIANGYNAGLEIDRIDVNGNYEPSNCRWVSSAINSQNTRLLCDRNTSGYRGVSKITNRNAYKAKITVNNICIWLGYFRDKIDAARAYDNYIIEHNLEHPINGV